MTIHIDLSDSAAIDALIEMNKNLKKQGLRGRDIDGTITTIDDKPVFFGGEE